MQRDTAVFCGRVLVKVPPGVSARFNLAHPAKTHGRQKSKSFLLKTAGYALEAVASLFEEPFHDARHVIAVRHVVAEC